jgi:riboflavin synthase
MFTGLVEETGTLLAREDGSDVARLRVRAPRTSDGAAVGDSIAVDGVCLTVTGREDEVLTADVVPETLRRTTLGALEPGARVNLERAVRADQRLGGHVVQGHVDGVGTVRARTDGRDWRDLVIEAEPALLAMTAPKGAITAAGVSLTVTTVTPIAFGVALIPTTLAATTLGDLVVGDPINLEIDVLARYVSRALQAAGRLP